MKILVTGAAGFIGSNLCDALLARGDEVIAIDNFNDFYDPARKHTNTTQMRQSSRCYFYEVDVRNGAALAECFAKHRPEVVAHLAGYGNVRYSIEHTELYTDVNIVGSVNMLEAARKHGIRNFVFASTSSVYGSTKQIPFVEDDACNHPLAPYPTSKKAIELMGHTYHHLHQLSFTAVRFFSVYGPRGRPDMMPYMVTDRLVHGEEIVLFDGGQMKRDWTYVGDIVAGLMAALDRPLGYEIINLGRGEPVLMADFIHIAEEIIGRKAVLRTPPAPLSEPKLTFASIDKAQRLLDYQPKVSINEGLACLWKWYQREVM